MAQLRDEWLDEPEPVPLEERSLADRLDQTRRALSVLRASGVAPPDYRAVAARFGVSAAAVAALDETAEASSQGASSGVVRTGR